MAQRDDYEDPSAYDDYYWGHPDPWTNAQPAPEPFDSGLPPYPAPDGQEWIKGPNGWELKWRGFGDPSQDDDIGDANRAKTGSLYQPSSSDVGGSGGGGSGGGYGGTAGFSGSSRPTFNFSPVPRPDLPGFSYAPMPELAKFNRPSGTDVLNEPGYAFREKQGRQALEQSAAGKGTLLTGGTLKDLIAYGQNFASNEYGNVYNRAKGEYDTDVDNQFRSYGTNYGVARDVFDREYKRASDLYAPTFAEWQMQNNAERDAGLSAFDREWDQYTFNADDEWRRLVLDSNISEADKDRILNAGMSRP